jgi:hypothetical protein
MPYVRYIAPPSGPSWPTLEEFTIFFGERVGSTAAPSGDPLEQRELFDSYLPREPADGPTSVEDWEDKTPNVNELDSTSSTHPGVYLVSGTISASWVVDTNGGVNQDGDNKIGFYDSPFGGRFNTTTDGAIYLEAALPIDITPEEPVDHWGAYFTDIGDFGTQLEIVLTDTDDIAETYVVDHTSTSDNTLHFWGFIDPTGKRYKKIRIQPTGIPFGSVVNFEDFYAVDDVVMGIAFDV